MYCKMIYRHFECIFKKWTTAGACLRKLALDNRQRRVHILRPENNVVPVCGQLVGSSFLSHVILETTTNNRLRRSCGLLFATYVT